MSDSNITLRSQEYGQRSRMFYDQQRFQSDQQMVQTLQQQVGMEMQRQEADIGFRLAIDQQQQQRSIQKIQMAHAIDQMDLSREQVRGARLQNQSIELELQERQRMLDPFERNKQQAIFEIKGSGGLLEMRRAGWVPKDPKNLMGGFKYDPDAAKLEDPVSATEDRMTTQMFLDAADPEVRAVGEARARERAGLPATPRAQAPKVDAAKVEETAKSIRTGFRTASPMNEVGGGPMPWADLLTEEHTKSIANYLWANTSQLMKDQQSGYDSDPARKGLTATPESAVKEIVDILNNPYDSRHHRVLAALREIGVLR